MRERESRNPHTIQQSDSPRTRVGMGEDEDLRGRGTRGGKLGKGKEPLGSAALRRGLRYSRNKIGTPSPQPRCAKCCTKCSADGREIDFN